MHVLSFTMGPRWGDIFVNLHNAVEVCDAFQPLVFSSSDLALGCWPVTVSGRVHLRLRFFHLLSERWWQSPDRAAKAQALLSRFP